MKCALCKNNAELRNSHIIPELIYKPMYDDKHTKESAMKTRIDIKSLALGILFGAMVVLTVGAATSGGVQKGWEYKIVHSRIMDVPALNAFEKDINKSVAEGWEFVSAHPAQDPYGFAVLRREKR